jgi:hypothetical protein
MAGFMLKFEYLMNKKNVLTKNKRGKFIQSKFTQAMAKLHRCKLSSSYPQLLKNCLLVSLLLRTVAQSPHFDLTERNTRAKNTAGDSADSELGRPKSPNWSKGPADACGTNARSLLDVLEMTSETASASYRCLNR